VIGLPRYAGLVFVGALYVFAILWWIRAYRGANADSIKDIPGPYDETIKRLAGVPRPGPIRISRRANWTGVLVLMIPLMVLGFAIYDQLRNGAQGITVGLLQFIVMLAILLEGLLWLPPLLKHKALVLNGELAVGEIIRIDRARNCTWVYYEFETAFGERVKKMSATFWFDLAPGMKTPVFYNRENPKKAIALCISFYDVVLTAQSDSETPNS
jgi:hypothetical protein